MASYPSGADLALLLILHLRNCRAAGSTAERLGNPISNIVNVIGARIEEQGPLNDTR